MAYPSDVLLPVNAKFFGFIDPNTGYNAHWDMSWTVTYSISGSEHAFCTFLTTNPSISAAIPGQYVGYLPSDTVQTAGILSVTFDTTGYSALSSSYYPGIHVSELKNNALIVRNSSNQIIYHEECQFDFNASNRLRFVLSSAARKLRIDRFTTNGITNVASVDLSGYFPFLSSSFYPGMTFCSPVSSSDTSVSTMFLSSFHVFGETSAPTFE